jgi:hypothetical protein
MTLLPLTQKQFAIVDDTDLPLLSKCKWHAVWSPCTKSFYAAGRQNGKYISMQVFILGSQADHKNHDTLDNRRDNLRKCTQAQNLRNQRLRKDNKSGYKGVSWHTRANRWRVTIQGKYVGNFIRLKEAAHAYDEAAKLHFGEFAHLNFPSS